MRDKYEQIRRNLVGHSDWPRSFRGRLTEDAKWDVGEFWKLNASLIEIAVKVNAGSKVERWFALALLTIQHRVLQLVSAHRDPQDRFRIRGVSETDLDAFLERFEHAIKGAISGEVLPQTSFDIFNPLRRE